MEKMNEAGIGQVEPRKIDADLYGNGLWEYLVNNPDAMIQELTRSSHVSSYPHPLLSKIKINAANAKIKELEAEIAKQNEIIAASLRLVKKYKQEKKLVDSHLRSGGVGRPERSRFKESVVKDFLNKWVTSLMEALQVKSCGAENGLEKLVVDSSERNWRRWLNGDAIPSNLKFDALLDSKISKGKYALLRNVPVTPTHKQMQEFLQLL